MNIDLRPLYRLGMLFEIQRVKLGRNVIMNDFLMVFETVSNMLFAAFPHRGRGKTKLYSLLEIRTAYFPNTDMHSCHCTNLHGKKEFHNATQRIMYVVKLADICSNDIMRRQHAY